MGKAAIADEPSQIALSHLQVSHYTKKSKNVPLGSIFRIQTGLPSKHFPMTEFCKLQI